MKSHVIEKVKFLFPYILLMTYLTYSQSIWTQRSIHIGDTGLNSVAWTGKKLVTVGNKGVVLTSPDGVTWTRQNSGTTANLNVVAWTGGRLIAVGETVLASEDGILWTNLSANISKYFWVHTLTRTDSMYICVGKHLLTSPDGVAWTLKPLIPDIVPITMMGATWTGNNLISAGYGSQLAETSDGVKWTARRISELSNWLCQSIVQADKQLVIAGDCILTSSDSGKTWIEQDFGMNPRPILRSIIWTGHQLLAVGGSRTILTSPDGINWSRKILPLSNAITFYSAVFTGTQYVVVGDEIWTSPQDVAIATEHSKKKNLADFFIVKCGSKIAVALPVSLKNQYVNAAIYSVTGKVLLENCYHTNNAGGVEITIGKLGTGRYVLVLSRDNLQFMENFCIVR